MRVKCSPSTYEGLRDVSHASTHIKREPSPVTWKRGHQTEHEEGPSCAEARKGGEKHSYKQGKTDARVAVKWSKKWPQRKDCFCRLKNPRDYKLCFPWEEPCPNLANVEEAKAKRRAQWRRKRRAADKTDTAMHKQTDSGHGGNREQNVCWLAIKNLLEINVVLSVGDWNARTWDDLQNK